jgi:hypothetical protein
MKRINSSPNEKKSWRSLFRWRYKEK